MHGVDAITDEFERKFLLPYLPLQVTSGIRDGKFDFEEIEQGYLPEKGGRIRKITSRNGEISYFYTNKNRVPNTHGLASYEKTETISKKEFKRYLMQIDGEVIFKTRYFVPIYDFILEINIFHGRLEGQVLGEVEFESMEAALSFEKPEWVGREVSNEISNRMLAEGLDIPLE